MIMIKKFAPAALLLLVLLLYGVVLFRSAWLCDDAYITFRVADNFVNGYGLRWNAAERVQAYTHPLWLFLHAGLYLFTREIYFTSIFFSMAVSCCALILYALFIASSPLSAVIGIATLASSKAFVDYSTSGLENPLTHLLLVVFCIFYFRVKDDDRRLFLVSLTAGLAAFNRMDTILFYIPAIIYLVSRSRYILRSIYLSVSGFIPFILWELFALFYYGFLFPNTAYAKLGAGIPATLLMKHGLIYIRKTAFFDPITLVMIAISFAIPFFKIRRGYIPLASGIFLYLLYIVRIGGGYMVGRYFSAPILMAVVLITHSSFSEFRKSWCFMLAFVLFLSFMSPYPTVLSDEYYGKGRDFRTVWGKVIDNRGYLFGSMGLLSVLDYRGNEVQKPEEVYGRKVYGPFIISFAVGVVGFAVGPRCHILDENAIADPLLARLPAQERKRIWISHFTRRIPAGYVLSLKVGRNMICNKNLAEFYDKIRLITRGDLFDVKRIAAIWEMNIGGYDHLLKDVHKPPHKIPRLRKIKGELYPLKRR